MSAFIPYWKAYADEAEAKASGKTRWSDASLSAGIVGKALQGLAASMDAGDDAPAELHIDELSEGIVGLQSHRQFRGIRFSLLAVEHRDHASPSALARELSDRARETICLCILPSVSLKVWPLSGQERHIGAATIIPLYPVDIDAIARGDIEILDLLDYKLHRRLLVNKPDPGTQFDSWLVSGFLSARRGSDASLQNIQEVLHSLPEDVREWLEHPLLSRVRGVLEHGRGCLLVGPSSSGKSVLALQVGRSFLLAGRSVEYINLGQTEGFPGGLFRSFFCLQRQKEQPLMIVDDLQSNPAAARYVLAVASAARRTSAQPTPAILAVSWVDYSQEAGTWFDDCLPIAVRPHQLREKLATKYRSALSERDINHILRTFREDIFLLRLSLEQSKQRKRLVGPAELALHVWESRRRDSKTEESEAVRVALVVGSLGRFDIPTPPGFLQREASVREDVVKDLLRTGLLRRHQANLSMGHRSLCGLIADWLASSDGWRELDRHDGPRSAGGVVLDYLRSLGSSLAVDSLRALHARAGFKDRPRLNSRAAALVELWEAFNAVLERIEHQQSVDATWGSVPSSVMFAVAAFSEVGKADLAREGIAFLRRHWNACNGGIEVLTEGLKTADDFAKIQLAMAKEDETSQDRDHRPLARDVDVEQFHRTWVLGLILCAEAASGEPRIPLKKLAQLVEDEQLPSGAFYPERVPWCTARVLLGLAVCGRTVDTSQAVQDGVAWLLRDTSQGGACSGGIWPSGTGSWNTELEATGMVLLSLAAVGYNCSHSRLDAARAYLLSQRNQWTAPGCELDGALAIQAFLDTGGAWEEVAPEAQKLSQWAKGEAFWQGATESAKESLDQSCRVAQIASYLISIGWTAIRSDLPGFLDALVTTDPFCQGVSPEKEQADEDRSAPREPVRMSDTAVDPELDALRRLESISLSDCTVVGGYLRYDERTRNKLRDWKSRIQDALVSQTQSHQNFLIWAAPGSGKSFFVKEIARALTDNLSYSELNLAQLSREDFCQKLAAVRDCETPVLCLLDEIDTRSDETWPYEECFSLLDLNLAEHRLAVFVLVGSASTGMEGMMQSMRRRVKGQDLLDRIPASNRFEIPPLSLEDQVVIVASQALVAADTRGQSLREIERLALYYIIKNRDLRTPRQLGDLAAEAIQRASGDDDRLKYDDLFHRGDSRNQQFWVEHSEVASELANTFVRLFVRLEC